MFILKFNFKFLLHPFLRDFSILDCSCTYVESSSFLTLLYFCSSLVFFKYNKTLRNNYFYHSKIIIICFNEGDFVHYFSSSCVRIFFCSSCPEMILCLRALISFVYLVFICVRRFRILALRWKFHFSNSSFSMAKIRC